MSEQLYPVSEPFESGLLDVGDANRIHWAISGNPDGKPAVVLHGGPGAGSSPGHTRFFDPERYLIIRFDQRGCGQSTPHASVPDTRLDVNTTGHLVADLERLRGHLGCDRWLVLGGSWGSALGLAYAQAHSQVVTELVLTGVCALRRRETEWYWGGGAAHLFPDAWQRFLAPVGGAEDVVGAYHRLLNDPDPAVHLAAARAWDAWDLATMAPGGAAEPDDDERATYAAARICNHYTYHDGWVPEGQLIAEAGRLAGIPGVLVQGRYDVQTPAVTAWELARAWPDAELVLVDGAGHGAGQPAMARELRRATDRFADDR